MSDNSQPPRELDDPLPETSQQTQAAVVVDSYPDASPDDEGGFFPIFEQPIEKLTELSKVSHDTSLFDTMQDDVHYVNYALAAVKVAFSRSQYVDDVCKLAVTTAKLLETRRNLLLKQYGMPPMPKSPNQEQGRGKPGRAFEPFDD